MQADPLVLPRPILSGWDARCMAVRASGRHRHRASHTRGSFCKPPETSSIEHRQRLGTFGKAPHASKRPWVLPSPLLKGRTVRVVITSDTPGTCQLRQARAGATLGEADPAPGGTRGLRARAGMGPSPALACGQEDNGCPLSAHCTSAFRPKAGCHGPSRAVQWAKA